MLNKTEVHSLFTRKISNLALDSVKTLFWFEVCRILKFQIQCCQDSKAMWWCWTYNDPFWSEILSRRLHEKDHPDRVEPGYLTTKPPHLSCLCKPEVFQDRNKWVQVGVVQNWKIPTFKMSRINFWLGLCLRSVSHPKKDFSSVCRNPWSNLVNTLAGLLWTWRFRIIPNNKKTHRIWLFTQPRRIDPQCLSIFFVEIFWRRFFHPLNQPSNT